MDTEKKIKFSKIFCTCLYLLESVFLIICIFALFFGIIHKPYPEIIKIFLVFILMLIIIVWASGLRILMALESIELILREEFLKRGKK